MREQLGVLLIAAGLTLSGVAAADTVKGRVMEISKKSGTIQVEVKDKDPVVVGFDAQTKYLQAASIDDLAPPDLIEVELQPGKPATQIKKVVFELPPGAEIDVQGMLAILTGSEPYTLIDARPLKQYRVGHVPSAKQAYPHDADFLSRLPPEKDRLLVFYCGGATCPYTSESIKIAQDNGYTKLKGFQAGIPGWKKAKLPVHASPDWVAESLNEAHVVIDVRDPAVAKAKHLPTAVSMPAATFAQMTETFIKEKRVAQLPGVKDDRAPIILYSNTHSDQDVLLAFKEVRSWGYKNATVLEGGLEAWVAAGRPTEAGKTASEIRWVKKLAPGAISPEEFVALEKSREGVFLLDVRTDQEVTGGMLKDAVHINLDQLEASLDKLPKDKEIIAYCANGIRAEMAYQKLKGLGYKVRYLNENIEVSKDGSYRL